MNLNTQEMITLIRSSVNVQVPVTDDNGDISYLTDPCYLVMTDEDIELYLKLALVKAFPDVDSFDDLPDGATFAIVLWAKIELYIKLAVARTDKVDLGADNNNYIKNSQRFKHYMDLVAEATRQYDDWLDNEGAEVSGVNVLNTYNVLLSNRHYTERNYELQHVPKVKLVVDNITTDSVQIRWSVSGFSHFARYKVYIGTSPVVDMYQDGAMYTDKLTENAECIKSTSNIRDCYHTLSGLIPNTEYYLAVFSIDKNQVFGYKQISFTTLEELPEEDDFSADTLGG